MDSIGRGVTNCLVAVQCGAIIAIPYKEAVCQKATFDYSLHKLADILSM